MCRNVFLRSSSRSLVLWRCIASPFRRCNDNRSDTRSRASAQRVAPGHRLIEPRLCCLHVALERLATLPVLPAEETSRTLAVLRLDALIAPRFRRPQRIEGVDDILRGAVERRRAAVRRFEQPLLRVALSSCRRWGGPGRDFEALDRVVTCGRLVGIDRISLGILVPVYGLGQSARARYGRHCERGSDQCP